MAFQLAVNEVAFTLVAAVATGAGLVGAPILKVVEVTEVKPGLVNLMVAPVRAATLVAVKPL
jgi:hypothetical protein